MRRTNAQVGDLVAVTGYVGNSGGGLRSMLLDPDETGDAAAYLRECHRRPKPAVPEGRLLVEAGVKTAMDVSDGLFDDLSKMCRASGVSARIDSQQVPLHPVLQQRFPDESLGLALAGGEDYILLFTGPAAVVEAAVAVLPQGASVIGEVGPGEPGRVAVVDESGQELTPPVGGWDHFA